MITAKSQKLSALPPGMRVPAARVLAERHMPYFSIGVQTMGLIEAPGLGTMACTEEGALMVDLEAIGNDMPLQAATGLLHEYLHHYLEHAPRFRAGVKRGLYKDPQDRPRWNTATDCEINDGLADAGLPMEFGEGEHMITPQSLGMPAHQTAEQYMVLLAQRPPQPPRTRRAGCGECGSAGGVPAPGEPPATPQGEQPAAAGAGRTPQFMADVRTVVDAAINQQIATKGMGSVPQAFAKAAQVRRRVTPLRWDQELALAARNVAQLRAGTDDYTYEMPSRWSGAFAHQSPRPIMPAMRQLVAEVAFVFDTSGSMGGEDTARLLGQAEQILKAVPGCRITIVACDARVHTMQRVKSVKDVKLVGGGGTDFRPAFDALSRFKPKPDLVVFGTDGYGSYPVAAPGFRTVWLQTPGGCVTAGFGKVIALS